MNVAESFNSLSRVHERYTHDRQTNEYAPTNVTTPAIIAKLFQLLKLFQRHWTCWEIFMSCNTPLKLFWKNFMQNHFSQNFDEDWNNFISHATTA